MLDKTYKSLVILIAVVALSACFTTTEAPVDSRATDNAYKAAPVSGYSYEPEPVTKGFHQVVKGDTLYSISWRYGMDYREIARMNNISGNYVIYPGQKLRLVSDSKVVVRPLQEQPAATAYPLGDPSGKQPENPNQLIVEDVTPTAGVQAVEPAPVKRESPNVRPMITQRNIVWRWPTTGEMIRSSSPVSQKGLDIAGRVGQQILSAADGVVVYSGSGLLGYGKLIIIKHNETYLSAYAHNQMIQVNEGDPVKGGQVIGTMGKGNKGQPLLHFEIRRDGKPVDPLQYLPARS
jgi:lipoprotein NlpD